jgi:large subunit ribosomal protein L15
MPLVRRLPKFGFTPVNRIDYAVINVEKLQVLVDAKKITDGVVTPEVLYALGVVSDKRMPVKVLGNGDITAALTVTAHKFSKSAIEKISAAGGSTKELVDEKAAAPQQ